MGTDMNTARKEFAYQQVQTESAIAGGDGRDLILMMYDGAIDSIRKANVHLSRAESRAFSDSLSRAMKIVHGLREILNTDAGGTVAKHLSDFYSYSLRNLVRANATQSAELLTETEALLSQVREAWATMNPEGEHKISRRLISVSA